MWGSPLEELTFSCSRAWSRHQVILQIAHRCPPAFETVAGPAGGGGGSLVMWDRRNRYVLCIRGSCFEGKSPSWHAQPGQIASLWCAAQSLQSLQGRDGVVLIPSASLYTIITPQMIIPLFTCEVDRHTLLASATQQVNSSYGMSLYVQSIVTLLYCSRSICVTRQRRFASMSLQRRNHGKSESTPDNDLCLIDPTAPPLRPCF